VDAENILHVGDDYVADCTGARNCGMQTVWINSPNSSNSRRADRDVHSYGEMEFQSDSDHAEADFTMSTVNDLLSLSLLSKM
jgi:FMN phosphatase YigB (HAD superfamily)